MKFAKHIVMGAAALLLALPALADEGGVPFWFSGQYASLAAVPATPGWSLPLQGYYYSDSASKGKSFTEGDSVTLGVESRGGRESRKQSREKYFQFSLRPPIWSGVF